MKKAAAVLAGLATFVAVAVGATAWIKRPPAAPEARFTTLTGETLATSQLRGKVVLVEFWATTCGVCIKGMPRMVDTYRRFAPEGFETVAVAMQHDRQGAVAAFAAKRGLPFKVVHDVDGQLAKQFGAVRLTPTTFLIDRHGRVLKRHVGEPDWAEFHALVEKALRS